VDNSYRDHGGWEGREGVGMGNGWSSPEVYSEVWSDFITGLAPSFFPPKHYMAPSDVPLKLAGVRCWLCEMPTWLKR
jgi:hypothetical protein